MQSTILPSPATMQLAMAALDLQTMSLEHDLFMAGGEDAETRTDETSALASQLSQVERNQREIRALHDHPEQISEILRDQIERLAASYYNPG